ncbi:MAG: hypothetical protein E7269_01480 [Lachnospiraceae bacterium]|nr:hypothetical protein [Lachnospiraceae bacterium]
MKKALSKIGEFLLTVLICFLFIILGIGLVFTLPFDYIKYKRSRYYKERKEKYSLWAASTQDFKYYNEIKEAGLPIEYVRFRRDDSGDMDGVFYYKDTMILTSFFEIFYDEERKTWLLQSEEYEEWLSLDEAMAEEMELYRRCSDLEICNRALIVADADYFTKDQLSRAEQNELILINYKDIATTLKEYISKHELNECKEI